MSLLAFDVPRGGHGLSNSSGGLEAPSYVSELLAPSQRLRTAGELNAAILASQSQGRDPKLPQLLNMLAYGEGLLGPDGPGKLEFPKLDLEGALGIGSTSSKQPEVKEEGDGDSLMV